MASSDLVRLLMLEDSNTRVVLLGTGLLGLASGVVGSLAVLRKRALLGDAVAHAALPGICLAYLIVGHRGLPVFLFGALVMGIVAAWSITFVRTWTKVREDAAIAIAIGSFFGFGIVLSSIIQRTPGGNKAGLDGFLFGKAASMVQSDAVTIAIVAGAVLVGVLFLYKELKLLCFDSDFAASLGRPIVRLDLVLMAMVCLCTVVGLPAVGIVMIVALLIIPGAAARFWTERLSTLLILAGGIGLASGVLGTAFSATVPAPAESLSRGWPTGPIIVLVASAFFTISMLLAPRRGLLASGVRRLRLRGRIARQNLLRSAYELSEASSEHQGVFRTEQLSVARWWKRWWLGWQLWLARRRGDLQLEGSDAWRMTSAGVEAAQRVVKAHRLWELYLIEFAAIAPDHVDRDADELEHVLPRELLDRLEERLAAADRADVSLPPSPHAFDAAQASRSSASPGRVQS